MTQNTSVTAGSDTNWLEHYALILKLKQELSRTLDLDEELEVVVRIASLYHECSNPTHSQTVHDPDRCYKSLFHSNCLTEPMLVLQKRLVKLKNTKEYNLLMLQQKMTILYSQLTTIECLNLYGYFSNAYSRYLLYILFGITQGHSERSNAKSYRKKTNGHDAPGFIIHHGSPAPSMNKQVYH